MNQPQRPISIAIAAMGGQGGGVLADWIIALAEASDCFAQSTSVPGVAQRTGATVYYLEVFPRSQSTDGRSPIMALAPVAGDVDIVIAGELVEAGRAVMRGFVTDRTTLIASSHRDYALTERMHMGDGRADSQELLDATQRAAKRFVAFDMAALAEQTGSVISAVLFGALAGSGVLPFPRTAFQDAIRAGGVGVKASLAGFEAGFAKAQSASTAESACPAPQAKAAPAYGTVHPRVQSLLDRIAREFRAPSHEILHHGLRRLVDFQDPDYAAEYLDRLQGVQKLDTDPNRGNELTGETARHLALWMSYEDTIRVAELKTRNTRIERVRRDARAAAGQIMHVVEFMHPRLQEICDTLPAFFGRLILASSMLSRVIGWFCNRGRQIRTSSLPGFLLLWCVSALKPMRRGTLRHQRESAEIRQWLTLIGDLAPAHYALAVEIARCQTLVKGYGDTHERGLANYRRILNVVPRIKDQPNAETYLRSLREAALADESGEALTDNLKKVA